jgi:SAM-dependent methyltransferase
LANHERERTQKEPQSSTVGSDTRVDSFLGVGKLGLSERLRLFVEEMPFERTPILEFMRHAAERLPPGSRVADVGAGDAPYREIFDHVQYYTVDWENSPHQGGQQVDLTASADAIPVPDESFDAVLLTQVLEHVPEPARVITELHRVLSPGGWLFLTAPLAWELHELPFDFYRYTGPGLEFLLGQAGFTDIAVTPRSDSFRALAQLIRNISHSMGRAPDGLDDRREAAAGVLLRLSEEIAALAPLDIERRLPLGYVAEAKRPHRS